MINTPHLIKTNRLLENFQSKRPKKNITLARKKVTHFMRKRRKTNTISLQNFNQVLDIDEKNLIAEVEANCTFYQVAQKTIKKGFVPTIVPELRGITVGGAIAGLGIEASSFKYGLVHETIVELDVLTGNGKIVTCSKDKNSDLFYTFPNSLGSLGYITKCKMRLTEAMPYIRTDIISYTSIDEFLSDLVLKTEEKKLDFLDAVIFSDKYFCIVAGSFVNDIPENTEPFDRFKNIFYKSLEENKGTPLYFHTWDYLWRWDTDAFWGIEYSTFLSSFLTNQWLRLAILRGILRTDVLLRVKKVYDKVAMFFYKLGFGSRYEELIQDAGITEEKFVNFTKWYHNTIGIYPVWVCPVDNSRNQGQYPLHPLTSKLVFDFGFYSRKLLSKEMKSDHYNKLLEKKLKEIDCVKGLYSTNSFSEEDFWQQYDKKEYLKVKNKYDKDNVYPDLYTKAMF